MSELDDTISAARFLPGQILADRYRVIERVGKGGMGEVYRAHDLRLGQQVALKFLPAELSNDPDRLRELFVEVRMARQISHPNVCRVHDIEELDGTQALSMEFVDGENLASLMLRIGRLPQDKACNITQEICAGLSAIHDRGVLHRDLKPANIMLDGRGHARITDFGLAGAQDRATDAGIIAGTPAYMAPEGFEGLRSTTARSDLYSLGLVMYELFTGRPAFEGATLQELMRARNQSKPVNPSKYVRELDPRIEQVILRCLEPVPARRPGSASEIAAILPGGDRISAMVAAGETPSPELVAAATGGDEGLPPAVAWVCLVALGLGLVALTAISPITRLVPRLPLVEPPHAMAGQARELLRELGVPGPPWDRAFGYDNDESAVDRIVANDRSRSRWHVLARAQPSIVSFWYRESSDEIVPTGPGFRVSYDDPPRTRGMSGVRLDLRGRLLEFDAPPVSAPTEAPLDPRLEVLFAAAGLDLASVRPVSALGTPPAPGDRWLAFTAERRDDPSRLARVEVVALHGQPVSFVVRDAQDVERAADPSRLATQFVLHTLRPALMIGAFVVGAWLARRNVRARRADPKRAWRVAFTLMAISLLAWVLGAHLTLGSATRQISTSLAWAFYDFAFGWIFYTAVEPYVRRLWPRMLTSTARLLDGRFTDARVGRELLIGCLGGVVIALFVAGHQTAPAWFGGVPGRPDNVGYIGNQLASLLGPRAQLAELATLLRANLQLSMGFIVILVLARITLRHPVLAILATLAVFVPLGLPRGEWAGLNVALAFVASSMLILTLVRFGLLAGITALIVHSFLESAPLGLGLGTWTTDATVLPLALVFGLGLYGFIRSLGGRPAIRDPLPAD